MSGYRKEIAVGSVAAIMVVIGLASFIAYLPFSPSSSGPTSSTERAPNGNKTNTSVNCTPFMTTERSSIACEATVTGDPPTGEVRWSAYSPAGAAVFSPDTCDLIDGSCTVNMTATPIGTVTVMANYLGDSTSNSSIGAYVPAVVTTTYRGQPVAIADDPDSGLVYVANGGSVLFVINATTNTIVGEIPGIVNGTTLAVDPITNMIFVGSSGGVVTVVNGSSSLVARRLSLSTGGESLAPFYTIFSTAVDATTGIVYVLMMHPGHGLEESIVAINSSNYGVVSNTTSVYFTNYRALAVDTSTGIVYALQVAGPCSFTGSSQGCGDWSIVTAINGALTRIIANVTVAYALGESIAVDSATDLVYVTKGYESGSVSVINGSTDDVIADFPAGPFPSSVCVNPATDTVYVGETGWDAVSVINGSDNQVVTTVTGVGDASSITVDPRTGQLYAANSFSGTVSVIDTTTDSLESTIYGWGSPSSVSVDSNSNLAYLGLDYSFFVSILNGSSGNPIDNVQLAPPNPAYTGQTDAVVNPVTGLVYTTSSGASNLTVLDGQTGAEVGSVDLGSLRITSISVDPITNMVYATGQTSTTVTGGLVNAISTVWEVNGTGDTIVGQVSINGLVFSSAVNPDTGSVYVSSLWTSSGSNQWTVYVLNGTTDSVVSQLQLPNSEYSFAVDTRTNVVYAISVPSGSGISSLIYAINGTSELIQGVIQIPGLGEGSLGVENDVLAVNPDTGLLYSCQLSPGTGANTLVVINGSYYVNPTVVEQEQTTTTTAITHESSTNQTMLTILNPGGNSSGGNQTTTVSRTTTVITTATRAEIVDSIQLPACDSVAVNSSTGTIYVVGGSSLFVVEVLGEGQAPP